LILAVIGIVLISGCIQEEVEKRGKIIEPAATTQLTFLDLAGAKGGMMAALGF